MKKHIYNTSFFLNGVFIILIVLLRLKSKEEISRNLIEETKVKIILFGDSIIKGGRWNKILERNDIKNSGFSGFTTSHLRWLINDNVIAYNPEICILEGGINDIGVGIPLERIKTNYRSLIDTLMSHNIEPFVQSTLYQVNNPESKILVDSLNHFLTNYCKQKDVFFLNINLKLSSDKGLKPKYSRDGTHITESAYLVWGNEIKEILNKIESKRSSNITKKQVK